MSQTTEIIPYNNIKHPLLNLFNSSHFQIQILFSKRQYIL